MVDPIRLRGTLPRGARPSPRSRLAAATPHRAGGKAPPHHIRIPRKLSFWGNYNYGDCVSAEEAFAKACHEREIFIPENEVIDWATQNNFLNGAYLINVVDAMESNGFRHRDHVYDDGAVYSVDWTNAAELRDAIFRGPVKLGVAGDQLDTVWWAHGGSSGGGVNGWFATGFYPDSQEDHCVSLCGYGTMAWLADHLRVHVPAGVDGTKPGYAMFTWDSIGIIVEPSMLAITQEAWLRVPTTVEHTVGV
jgi:hypothetical protein